MNPAVASQFDRASRRPVRLAQACACAGALLGAGAGFAADPVAAGSVIAISASNLPRFDNFDGSSRTQQRLDMALLSPGRSAFGVTMGITGLSPTRPGFNAGAADSLPGVNLGLQYRYMFDNNRRIDITAWREMGRPNDALSMVQSRDAGFGARVEMQLAGSRSPLVAERGFVGVQLDGGARIALRRSGGKPMVYYRSKF
jgi:hypothetical protein